MIERTIRIPDGNGRSVTFTLRLPNPLPAAKKLPALVVLAGIKTDDRTLEVVPDWGDNALIAYHYDYDRSTWKSLSNYRRGRICQRMTREVGGQIAALVLWVKAQPWADPDRVNLAGGSLGAIVMPMILHELLERGGDVRTVTFAYGGASRLRLGYLCLRHRSWWLAAVGGSLAWLLLRRLEPAIHLPHLRGDFLLISCPDDTLVPRICSKLFEDLTPEPKTIVLVDGGHVSNHQHQILQDVIATIRDWLLKKGALNT